MSKQITMFLIILGLIIIFVSVIGSIFVVTIHNNRKVDLADSKNIENNVVNEVLSTTESNSISDNIDTNEVEKDMSEFIIEVNNRELIVKLEENSSAVALMKKLKEGNIIIDAHDYSNFEKAGELGFELPTNDRQITTKAGDVILYLGTRFVLYYDTNSWNFTKLGEVTNVNGEELKDILGDEDVTMILKIK